jgi:arabinogalactan oligomer/maltooligosaccharide transport system permease protein
LSIVAQESSYARPGEAARTEGLVALLIHPAALGTLVAAALCAALTWWFVSQARHELAEDAWNRAVIMQLQALGDTVAAIEAADGGNIDEVLQSLPAGDGFYKALRLSGARLLASTDPADAGDRLAPRRLSRDEKWLFDLGQLLRASVETNVSEGVRRRQVDITPLGESRVRVSVPYFVGGKVHGIVQAERPRQLEVEKPSAGLAVAASVVPWLLMAGFLAVRRSREAWPEPTGRNWSLFGLAVLLVLLAGYAVGRFEVAGAVAYQAGLTDALAGEFRELDERMAYLAGSQGVTVSPGAGNAWDVDLYQRPLGVIGGDGQVRPEGIAAQADLLRSSLSQGLWGNLAAAAAVLGFFTLGFATRTRRALREHRYAYFYVLPAMFGMLILVFFPFIYGITLSFTAQTVLNVSEPITEVWTGFSNYVSILADFDIVRTTAEESVINYQNFYWTLFITVCWTVTNVTVGVSFGMILALILNTKGLRFTNAYRVLLILPWAIPNYITALIWKGMFHKQFGVINQAIQMFGGEPVAWFDGVFSAFMTGLITNGWLSFPFMMVIILGGLQSISQDMYEAATIDGASKWQQFVNITLPSLKPTIIPAVIISVVWTFNMFNIIYLVSGGEPAGANEILITKAYKIAFEEYRYGYAAAYSVVIFLILLVYGVFQTRMTRATEATTT